MQLKDATAQVRSMCRTDDAGEPGEIRMAPTGDGWNVTAIWVRDGRQEQFFLGLDGSTDRVAS
jgi:hypothetical protein